MTNRMIETCYIGLYFPCISSGRPYNIDTVIHAIQIFQTVCNLANVKPQELLLQSNIFSETRGLLTPQSYVFLSYTTRFNI